MTAGGPGSATADLTYTVEGDVGLITLHRPEARNALTWQMYAELERVVRSTDGPLPGRHGCRSRVLLR